MTDTTPSRNKILVTGANSGLGKFIASQIDCDTLTRSNSHSFLGQVQVPSYDVIIHCAFNSKKDVKNYYDIVQDNIFLTKDLCQISHKKFVFLSSVDVYEEENNLYKTSKLMSESIVKNLATKPLILRCSAILGKTMRKNNCPGTIFNFGINVQLCFTRRYSRIYKHCDTKRLYWYS